jgi:hypothetical protein
METLTARPAFAASPPSGQCSGSWSGTLSACGCPPGQTGRTCHMNFTSEVDVGTIMPLQNILQGGYHFTMPGSHPATTVSVTNPTITLKAKCPDNSTHDIVIPLAPYSVTIPANTNGCDGWCPANDEHSPLVCQGAIFAPDVCGGRGYVLTSHKGTFDATVTIDTCAKVNFQFHYSKR